LPIGLIVVALLPSGALAQSSVGRAANTATGQSLRDAVEQQQNEFLNSSGVGAGGGAGAAVGAGASPTGRLRSSDHDALKLQAGFSPDENNYAWKTKEGSAFGTGVYTLPGTVLGGQMKVSMFGGIQLAHIGNEGRWRQHARRSQRPIRQSSKRVGFARRHDALVAEQYLCRWDRGRHVG
jgi:hypothetical protein